LLLLLLSLRLLLLVSSACVDMPFRQYRLKSPVGDKDATEIYASVIKSAPIHSRSFLRTNVHTLVGHDDGRMSDHVIEYSHE
jgi:hypothetical protein